MLQCPNWTITKPFQFLLILQFYYFAINVVVYNECVLFTIVLLPRLLSKIKSSIPILLVSILGPFVRRRSGGAIHNSRHFKPKTRQTPDTFNLRHIKPQTKNIGLPTTHPFHISIKILFENLKIDRIFTWNIKRYFYLLCSWQPYILWCVWGLMCLGFGTVFVPNFGHCH